MCLLAKSLPVVNERVVSSVVALLFDINGQNSLKWVSFFELTHNGLQSIITFVTLDHEIVEDG